jgi:hypothetical protein
VIDDDNARLNDADSDGQQWTRLSEDESDNLEEESDEESDESESESESEEDEVGFDHSSSLFHDKFQCIQVLDY